jgi:carboxyl-terminal processing protease
VKSQEMVEDSFHAGQTKILKMVVSNTLMLCFVRQSLLRTVMVDFYRSLIRKRRCNSMVKSSKCLWLAVLLVTPCLPSIHAAPSSARNEVFDEVWQTVRDNFLDRHFNGMDWDTARQRYSGEASKAPSDQEFAVVINTMLAELSTSHTRFYTVHDPEYYQLAGILWSIAGSLLKPHLTGDKPTYPGIGISTYESDGRIFVRNVFDGMPAAEAGLLSGDQILSADGAPFQPVDSFANKVGQLVHLKVKRTADAAATEIVVKPKVLDGATMFLDALKASVQIIDIDDVKVGYVHMWAFTGELYSAKLDEELNGRLRDADALVLDLRDGWGGANPRCLWPFFAPTLEMKSIPRGAKPVVHQEAWTKPVCLLVNEGTRSGKELLTYQFKNARRGPVVGSKTAGAMVFGRPFVMRDGSLLFLAVTDLMVDGKRIEGVGVSPDITVPFRNEFSAGDDPQKRRALEVIARASKKR